MPDFSNLCWSYLLGEGQIGIAFGATIFTGIKIWQKSVKRNYKKLGKHFEHTSSDFLQVTQLSKDFTQDMKGVMERGDIDEINRFEDRCHDILHFLYEKQSNLNKRIGELTGKNFDGNKVKQKVSHVVKKDQKVAKQEYESIREDYTNISSDLQQKIIYLQAYQLTLNGNPQQCLDKLNGISINGNPLVAYLKFNAYLQLNDMEEANKFLPYLPELIRTEYQHHIKQRQLEYQAHIENQETIRQQQELQQQELQEKINTLDKAINEVNELIKGDDHEATHAAINRLLQLAETDELKLFCQNQKGFTFTKEKKYQEALSAFELAESHDPKNINTAVGKSSILAEMGQLNKAIDTIQKLGEFGLLDNKLKGFLSEYKAVRTSKQILPFMRSLSIIAHDLLQREDLCTFSRMSLTSFLVVHQIHPQALVALPNYLLTNCQHTAAAWEKVLCSPFSSGKSVFFLANSVMASLEMLGLGDCLPLQNTAAGLMNYGQTLINAVDFIQDYQAGTCLATGSAAFAVSMLIAPTTLYVYDSFMHRELAPETVAQCAIRDVIPHGLHASVAYAGLAPEIMPFVVAAHAVIAPARYYLGEYEQQARVGMLHNARQLVLKDGSQHQNAITRYQQLRNFCIEESDLVMAIESGEPLREFNYALGKPDKVDVFMASQLLSKHTQSSAFDALSSTGKDSRLHELHRMALFSKKSGLPDASMLAHQSYASSLSRIYYCDTSAQAFEQSTLDFISSMDGQIANRAVSTQIFDFAKNIFGYKTTTGHQLEKLSEIQTNTELHIEIARKFSSGDIKQGFAMHFFQLYLKREKEKIRHESLQYEVMLVHIMAFIFSENSDFLEQGSKIKIDEALCISYLLAVQLHCKNARLKQLAEFLHQKFFGKEVGNGIVLFPSVKKHFRHNVSDIYQKHRELSQLSDDLHKMDTSTDDHESFTELNMLETFFNLSTQDSPVEPQLIEKLLNEFTHISEHDKKRRFKYIFDIELNLQRSLVEVYLYAMLGFMVLMREVVDADMSNGSIEPYKYTVLNNILLRAYQPPLKILLIKQLSKIPEITTEQAYRMISWYLLDNDSSHTVSKKFDLLEQLNKDHRFNGTLSFDNLGELCCAWSTMVRNVLFRTPSNKTQALYEAVTTSTGDMQASTKALTLLQQGANSNYDGAHGMLVNFCIKKGWPNTIELLCQYGADLSMKNNKGLTAIQYCVILFSEMYRYDLVTIEAILTKYGANLETEIKTEGLSWDAWTWWWRCESKSSKDLLMQQKQLGRLTNPQFTAAPISSLPLLALPQPTIISPDAKAKNQEHLQKNIAYYSYEKMMALIQYYFQHNGLTQAKIYLVDHFITFIDNVRRLNQQAIFCANNSILVTHWQGSWSILLTHKQVGTHPKLLYPKTKMPTSKKAFERLLGVKIEVYQPIQSIAIADELTWLVEMARIISEQKCDDIEQTHKISLTDVRVHAHQAVIDHLLTEQEASSMDEDEVDDDGSVIINEIYQLAKIHYACMDGKIDRLVQFLSYNSQLINLKSGGEFLPMHHAAAFHHPEVLRLLILSGSPIDDRVEDSGQQKSALLLAITRIKLDDWTRYPEYRQRVKQTLVILIMNGLSLLDEDSVGRNAYTLAGENQELLADLLQLSSELESHINRLIHLASTSVFTDEDLVFLQHCKQFPGMFKLKFNQKIKEILEETIKNGDVKFLTFLLTQNLEHIKYRYKHGSNLLHLAVSAMRQDMVALLLLDYPWMLNQPNENGDIPIFTLLRNMSLLTDDSSWNRAHMIFDMLFFALDSDIFCQNRQKLSLIDLAKQLNPIRFDKIIMDINNVCNRTSAFLLATYRGDIEKSQAILKQGKLHGYQKDMTTPDGHSSIHKSIEQGNLKLTHFLLSCFPNLIIAVNSHQETPLHILCKNYSSELLDLLLSSAEVLGGQNLLHKLIFAKDINGLTAFDYAIQQKNIDLFRKLLIIYRRFLTQEKIDDYLSKCLELCIESKNITILSCILVYVVIEHEQIPNIVQLVYESSEDEKTLFWQSLFNARQKYKIDESLYTDFIAKLSNKIPFYLIQKEMENLQRISLECSIEMTLYGVNHGANLYIRNCSNSLSIHTSAWFGANDLLIEMYLRDNDLINMKGGGDWLPIHHAVANHQLHTTMILLGLAPEYVNTRVSEGHDKFSTPLLLTIERFVDSADDSKKRNLEALIKLLICSGADPMLPNANGETARDLLIQKGLPLNWLKLSNESEQEAPHVTSKNVAPSPQFLQKKCVKGIYRQQQTYFEVHQTSGFSDSCGYFSLPIPGDRLGAARLLLANKHDVSVRRAVSSEIAELAITGILQAKIQDNDIFKQLIERQHQVDHERTKVLSSVLALIDPNEKMLDRSFNAI